MGLRSLLKPHASGNVCPDAYQIHCDLTGLTLSEVYYLLNLVVQERNRHTVMRVAELQKSIDGISAKLETLANEARAAAKRAAQ